MQLAQTPTWPQPLQHGPLDGIGLKRVGGRDSAVDASRNGVQAKVMGSMRRPARAGPRS